MQWSGGVVSGGVPEMCLCCICGSSSPQGPKWARVGGGGWRMEGRG
eukprot:CAMPEP_0173170494 /NCGR_PEP_ID=MMETSP1141-20130122/1263_1 /TAXON_ID=483371 /ORGANISM="non described non described, Strain CCMP2298" /LENGTH=45 /DNA_ID= /DNA_START= /DNA_END= /DNA_ORIENTATION=